ncbi:MAG: LPS export ABC transporter permease LptF [Desulfobacterales bacterium]|nr:LPS export ABC transporter permease LptF [Desulfobacterales bacterium]
MKINTIINRYIFREMVPPFIITMVFFTFVFLMAEMLRITNWIVNYNIGLLTVFSMIAYMTPSFLVFVIPMSVMMAVMLTFIRMSGDHEIIALKAGGGNIHGLLPPVFLLGLVGFALTFFMAAYGQPWGRVSVKELMIRIISSHHVGLEERRFNDEFPNTTIYVSKIDTRTRELIDVFIEDQQNEKTVITLVAPRAVLATRQDGRSKILNITLFNGTFLLTDLKNHSTRSGPFSEYNMPIDLEGIISAAKKLKLHRKEMSLSELREYIENAPEKNKKYFRALLEYHRKFSIPFAAIMLGLLAVPLGIQTRGGGKSTGMVLGLFFFLVYYLILSAGMVFGENGAYPPLIGMWTPNIVMGCIGIFLLYRTSREKPLYIDALINAVIRRIPRMSK